MPASGRSASSSTRARGLRLLELAAGVAVFAIAMAALHHALTEYRYDDIRRALGEVPRSRILLSLGLTCVGYLSLTGYDVLALRYVGRGIPYRQSAMASFISYAVGTNAGFGNFASSSIRYRLYTGWGLGALEIAKLIAFCTLTFWAGYLAVAGIALTFDPFPVFAAAGIRLPLLRVAGAAMLVLLAAYAIFGLVRRGPLRVRGLELEPPAGRLFAAQVLISAVDWAMAGLALYVLLPPAVSLSWLAFMGVYMAAGLAALVSHVPGGIGVLESTLVALLVPAGAPADAVLGSVLVYRGIYYVLPLLIASVLFAVNEALPYRTAIASVSRAAAASLSALAPPLLAMTTFSSGVILLLSGATPAPGIGSIASYVPLAVIEASHFLAGIIGAALVIVARGLVRRLDGAMRLASVLLGVGATLSFLKGEGIEQSLALGIVLGALLASRREFYRKSALLNEPTTETWAAAAAVAVLGSIWLGVFAYQHVEYSSELWWRFEVDQHAPRFLRASVGIVTAFVLFAIYRLVRPVNVEPAPPTAEDMERVREIVEHSTRTSSSLALLGDKAFLFNEAKTAFIMYGVEGRTWIAMGDPVGPEEEWSELVWRFQRECDRHAARPVFYEVSARRLDLYADLGLALLKLGEEARVDLERFSLEGGERKDLRYTLRHIEKSGCSFRIVQQSELPGLLPRLRAVSDDWLSSKNAREKGFSLGRFDEAYISSFPCALVESAGEIVAFANLWLGAAKSEASIDLMRHASDAPNGVMEYLFVRLLLWAQQEGFRTFSLGVAPLAGLERRAAASLWYRLGTFVYKHGEHFYNFEGLRRYKDKFGPAWEPVYLACPTVWSLPQIFADLSVLVSGGVQGVLRK